MSATNSEVTRREPPPAPKRNGNGADTGEDRPSEGRSHRYGTLQRPYIVESQNFASRWEIDLMYADNELALVRANISALQERESDLMKIRNGALAGLGEVAERQEEEHGS